MSPEFILRPSLSGNSGAAALLSSWRVSPEFILRPSLSEDGQLLDTLAPLRRVAGVYTPAFVERWSRLPRCWRSPAHVSPEFILRPSLSERVLMAPSRATSARVAGVYTPAFVERASMARDPRRPAEVCRRSLYSGLR